MSHTEYSAQFVQYSSVFLGLEEAPKVPNLTRQEFPHGEKELRTEKRTDNYLKRFR